MPVVKFVAQFINPSSGNGYRLILVAPGWRITKSQAVAGQTRLAHLRGICGDAGPDLEAIRRLVAGESQRMEAPADPRLAFSAVVLTDLERTVDVLVAVANEARDSYEKGRPGFRYRSPVLREQRDAAMARVVQDMRAMAGAWRASGLVAGRPFAEWLGAALGETDQVKTAVKASQ